MIRLRRALVVVAFVAVGAACSSQPTSNGADAAIGADTDPPDAAPADTTPTDTTSPDAAPADVPPVDATPVDAAPVDTGSDDVSLDAPPADAAPADVPPVDAPAVDAPAVDAPAVDALPIDAPTVDAPAVDAPTVDAPPADVMATNPSPRIVALSPPSASAGDASFTLTITGASFLPGSTVTWAGTARTVTYVSATTLRINVTAADVAAAGTASVVVTNPAPGGGAATASFAVYVPFTSSTWLAGSTFRTASGWFNSGAQDRVWLADIDGDHLDDVVGIADDGSVWVSRGTGTAFAASAMLPTATIFRVAADWFQATSRPRVWLTDVTGDGRADLVGVDFSGGVWVSESNGTSFNASHLTATTSFASSAGYFATADQPHVFLGDVNADGKTDLVGLNPATGRIGVAVATGTGSAASFLTDAAFVASSVFTTGNGWFSATLAPRLFFGDVTGDRRADFVGLAGNGDLYVAESTGTAMNAPRRVGGTVFSDANGWFASAAQPRVSLADVNGDGKLDVVGVGAPAVGDGDIWTLESTGTGSTADAFQHVLLHESAFRAADGWFAATARPSVWFADVTGDGRADALGVDARGGVWVARSVAETSSPGVTPAGRHDLLLPAVRNGDSGFTASAFFDPAAPRRVWVGDVTGDGARDLVAISGADGDIRWRMSAPAMVRSISPVTRRMLTSGAAQRIAVTLTRRIAPAAFDASALAVAQDQTPVAPSGVMTSARGATFDVTFPAPSGADTRLDLALGARATDAWGHGIDGDGDGLPGGTAARPARWSPTLVAGASRVSFMPDDATGVPRSSGFG